MNRLRPHENLTKIVTKIFQKYSRKYIPDNIAEEYCTKYYQKYSWNISKIFHEILLTRMDFTWNICYVWRASLSSLSLWVTRQKRVILREIRSQRAGSIIKLLVFIKYPYGARERCSNRAWLFVRGADESSWSWLRGFLVDGWMKTPLSSYLVLESSCSLDVSHRFPVASWSFATPDVTLFIP